jgi:hypothetical protein
LRERLPGRHPFAPTKVCSNEATNPKSLPDIFFRKSAQIRSSAINVDHSHSDGVFKLGGAVKSMPPTAARYSVEVLKRN